MPPPLFPLINPSGVFFLFSDPYHPHAPRVVWSFDLIVFGPSWLRFFLEVWLLRVGLQEQTKKDAEYKKDVEYTAS